MTDPIDTFIAKLSGFSSIEDYQARNEALFDALLSAEMPVKTTELTACEHYSLLNKIDGVDCYLFNSGQSKRDGVDVLNKKRDMLVSTLSRFSKSCQIKDHATRAAARYLLWGKYYAVINRNDVLRYLKKQGALRVQRTGEHTELYIIGLHGKVGNNVFSIDRRGREHRLYNETCSTMAFPCGYGDMPDKADFLDGIPVLETYRTTYTIADAKGCVRPIRLTRKERETILQLFTH